MPVNTVYLGKVIHIRIKEKKRKKTNKQTYNQVAPSKVKAERFNTAFEGRNRV